MTGIISERRLYLELNPFQDYQQFDPTLDFATPLSKWGNINKVEDLKPYLDLVVAEAVADPQSYRLGIY